MIIKRIEHVGVVVKDTEASRKLWEGCFCIPLGGMLAGFILIQYWRGRLPIKPRNRLTL